MYSTPGSLPAWGPACICGYLLESLHAYVAWAPVCLRACMHMWPGPLPEALTTTLPPPHLLLCLGPQVLGEGLPSGGPLPQCIPAQQGAHGPLQQGTVLVRPLQQGTILVRLLQQGTVLARPEIYSIGKVSHYCCCLLTALAIFLTRHAGWLVCCGPLTALTIFLARHAGYLPGLACWLSS